MQCIVLPSSLPARENCNSHQYCYFHGRYMIVYWRNGNVSGVLVSEFNLTTNASQYNVENRVYKLLIYASL